MINDISNFVEKKLSSFSTESFKPLIVIYGATASGKSQLAITLAHKFNGEIISADSRAVYKDTHIGSDIPSLEEQQGIPHHLIDFVGPERVYSVKNYQYDARKCIDHIQADQKLPILIGGTNMYIDAVIQDYSFEEYQIKDSTKAWLSSLSTQEQFELLQKRSPHTAAQVDPKNPRHWIRKLERIISNGDKYLDRYLEKTNQQTTLYNCIHIGIQRPREEMYARINERVYREIEDGLIEETQHILNLYPKNHPARTGLGHRQVTPYLSGLCTREEMIRILQRDTRHFAKRQMTWLRKNKEIQWFRI